MVATLAPTSPKPIGGSGSSHLTAYIEKGVAVSDPTLEAVGLPSNVQAPNSVPDGAPLMKDGKPVVVFVGAEFCPYCALERWALVVALSRFGTFSNLGQTISSSSTDVDPGLESWSFKDSTFTSPLLAFAPAEVYSSTPNSTGTGYEPLQSLTPLQSQAFGVYSDRGYPFVDIAGKYVALGASADPAVLQNLTLDQIASELDDPSSPVAQSVDGTANDLIAAMCSVTSTSAAPICTSPVIAQAQTTMAANPYSAGGPSGG
jgi:thiol-disulfide isomerase/thioredoxin